MFSKLLRLISGTDNDGDVNNGLMRITIRHGTDEYSENYQYSLAINLVLYKKELSQLNEIAQFDSEDSIVCKKCGYVFLKKPKRKTKCKNCNEYIFVRTYPYPANRLDKCKIYVNGDGLALLETMGEFSYETLAYGNITLKTIYLWFKNWYASSNTHNSWDWYQYLRRKYIQNVKYLYEIYSINSQMVQVCINRKKYEIAMGYVAECLAFNKKEDDELMPGIVYLYQDIEKCVGQDDAIRLLEKQSEKFNGLIKSKIFKKFIKETKN